MAQVLTAFIPRHAHAAPYAALVLEGSYEEAGETGRVRVEAGDVILHGPFSAHQDRAGRRAVVLDLPLPALTPSGLGTTPDLDAVIWLAGRDPQAAADLLLTRLSPKAAAVSEATDALAAALLEGPPVRIAAWSHRHGVARETAFRWFHQAYGVAPSRYRVEARARRAWRRIVESADPLAAIAAAEGFTDQAQMTRDIRALTGRPPGAWRLQHSFKTAAI